MKKVVDFCIEPAADDDVVTTGVKVCNTSAIISCSGCWFVELVVVEYKGWYKE